MRFSLIFTCLFLRLFSDSVMGIGFGTIDQLVQVSHEQIREYTTRTGGSFHASPQTIDRILDEIGTPPKIVPGGSAANTIRVLSVLGQQCAFLGPIGQDELGTKFRQNLEGLGIKPCLKDAEFTSRILCLIAPDGQRTFLGHDPQIIGQIPDPADLDGVKWIHFEARSLTIDQPYMEALMAMAHVAGIRMSMDLSSYNLVEKCRDDLARLISKYMEIVFANEDEILALTGEKGEEGCMKLQELCPVGVVTLGDLGCLVGSKGRVRAIPGYPAATVDTTGSGDYFSAGFLYGYLREQPLSECGRLGNRLGSAIVEVIGTELPKERWELILK